MITVFIIFFFNLYSEFKCIFTIIVFYIILNLSLIFNKSKVDLSIEFVLYNIEMLRKQMICYFRITP